MKNVILIIVLALGMMANAQEWTAERVDDAIDDLSEFDVVTPSGTSTWISTDRIPVLNEGYVIPDLGKPTLYDAERKNDTLYLYYRETSMTTYGCLVMNCTQDHSPPVIKYRIPFYADNGKIAKGEKQHPKHIEVKREVIEYKEEW